MPLFARKISVLLLMMVSIEVSAQRLFDRPDSLSKSRAIAVLGAQGLIYTGSLTGLQFAWYNQYQNGGFHFFNDWPGWMQMDKIGHSVTAYQAGHNLYLMNRWAGMTESRSIWVAAGMSYSYQLAIEVMDGFSDGWGFSLYDQLFNTVGTAAFVGQQFGWKEQRIRLKYSFWPSGLTDLPGDEGRRARNLYGEGLHEQWLKDYNGQTYWASVNLWSMVGKPDRFPKWLNVAVGYSVNNVLGAESNTWTDPDNEEVLLSSTRARQRQFLLSLDVVLQHTDLPRALAWIKPVFGVVKFPFPSLEYNTETGFGGHWMYW